MTSSSSLTQEILIHSYGNEARICEASNTQFSLVFSQSRPMDLVELEQLLEAVGWTRRPVRRVRKL